MFEERKKFSMIIQNNAEKYTVVNFEHQTTSDDFENIYNLTLQEIDDKFLKALSFNGQEDNQQNTSTSTIRSNDTKNIKRVNFTDRHDKTGFLKNANKFYIDAKLIKENIFPFTFNDYVVFARQQFLFPPCIASIILKCVDNKQHPKNNERLILGKFLFSLYFSEDQVSIILLLRLKNIFYSVNCDNNMIFLGD